MEAWDTGDIIRVLEDTSMDTIPTHFLSTYYTDYYFSEEKRIRFEELPVNDRILAPYVKPLDGGRPLYREQGTQTRDFLPPYVKMTDPLTPGTAVTPMAREVVRGRPTLSLAERYDLRSMRIAEDQTRALAMREAVQAFDAMHYGKLRFQYERDLGADNPDVELDFDRAANLTDIKLSGYWSDPSAKIYDDLEDYANRMNNALRGGWPAVMYIGTAVTGVFKKNTQIKEMLDTTYRGTAETSINRAITRVDRGVTFIGHLEGGIDVYSVKEDITLPNGNVEALFPAKEVLMVAPGFSGIRAYGAIWNLKAIETGTTRARFYPSRWMEPDGSAAFVQLESSPLMLPVDVNKTLRAKVIA